MNLQSLLLVASLIILAVWAYAGDRRSRTGARNEEFRKRMIRFDEAARLLPGFIAALRADLSDRSKAAIRELFIVSRNSPFEGGAGALVYYLEDHPDLENSIGILADNGYLSDVTVYNVKKYRLSEEFVRMLFAPAAGTVGK